MKTIEQLQEWILARREVFARCGAVVESWRTYRGTRLGPYFRLIYRQDGREHSVYLGRSPELAVETRRLLDQLQGPLRQRREIRQVKRQIRASLRAHKALWQRDIAPLGLQMKGTEIRGWRLGRAPPRFPSARDRVC